MSRDNVNVMHCDIETFDILAAQTSFHNHLIAATNLRGQALVAVLDCHARWLQENCKDASVTQSMNINDKLLNDDTGFKNYMRSMVANRFAHFFAKALPINVKVLNSDRRTGLNHIEVCTHALVFFGEHNLTSLIKSAHFGPSNWTKK